MPHKTKSDCYRISQVSQQYACLLTKPLSSKTPLPIPPNNYRLPSWFKAVKVNHYSGKMHDNYFKRFRFVYLLEP